jgi:gliding motility-associated-like protein
MDKICKDIDLVTSLWIPNVFTPDADGFNDRFVVLIHGEVYYDMKIYDRWGKQVFEGHNRHETWDGVNQNDGQLCLDGTYYYVFNYRHIGGIQKQAKGTVTLLRN